MTQRSGHDNTPFVVEYMEKHAGKLVTTAEVARAVGMASGTTSGVLTRLHAGPGPIERVALGVYRWNVNAPTAAAAASTPSTPAATGYMVEVIGRTRDGHPLGEGEDGVLWVLHERGGK